MTALVLSLALFAGKDRPIVAPAPREIANRAKKIEELRQRIDEKLHVYERNLNEAIEELERQRAQISSNQKMKYDRLIEDLRREGVLRKKK